MIETLKFFYLLVVLIYFSYLDVQYRKIPDKLILWSYIIAVPFLIKDINTTSKFVVFSATMLFYFGFFNIFYRGLDGGIGGADIKIMLLIVMLYPGILPLVILLIAYLIALIPSMWFRAKKVNYGFPFVVFITAGFLIIKPVYALFSYAVLEI